MKTSIKGRHLQVTPELHAQIERKLEKVERLLSDSAVSVQVILDQEGLEFTAEVVLHARGDHMLHGDGHAATWIQAVAMAVDKVDHQAHTLKGKWEARHRRS
jgi:ribosomal subunit interface protein